MKANNLHTVSDVLGELTELEALLPDSTEVSDEVISLLRKDVNGDYIDQMDHVLSPEARMAITPILDEAQSQLRRMLETETQHD